MAPRTHGDNASNPSLSHISPHGIWLLSSAGKALFMPYDEFPWFMGRPVKAIHNVEEPSPGHFYWPVLDVDLSEEMIESPSRFPLRAS